MKPVAVAVCALLVMSGMAIVFLVVWVQNRPDTSTYLMPDPQLPPPTNTPTPTFGPTATALPKGSPPPTATATPPPTSTLHLSFRPRGYTWYKEGMLYADAATDIELSNCAALHRLMVNGFERIKEEYDRGSAQGMTDRLTDIMESDYRDKPEAGQQIVALFMTILLARAPDAEDPDTWPPYVDWFEIRMGLGDGYVKFCERHEKGTPTPPGGSQSTPTPSRDYSGPPPSPAPTAVPKVEQVVDKAPGMDAKDKVSIVVLKADGQRYRYLVEPGVYARTLLEDGDILVNVVPPTSIMGNRPPKQ